MELETLRVAVTEFATAVESIAGQSRDPHDSTIGKLSSDAIKHYNMLARVFMEHFPSIPVVLFREDTSCLNADHPRTVEILSQLRVMLHFLGKQ